MRIVIMGGHGKIALLLAEALAARGDDVVSVVRNPDHRIEITALAATPVVCDLEAADVAEVGEIVSGADAVVFAAGAGANSGAARKLTLDRDGAILTADACEAAGVRRLVVVSAHRTDTFDPDSDDVFQVYLRAKSEADANIRARDLDWVILRPGGLTDDPGLGLVELASEVPQGTVPRADVAAVITAILDTPAVAKQQLELVTGEATIDDAIAGLAAG